MRQAEALLMLRYLIEVMIDPLAILFCLLLLVLVITLITNVRCLGRGQYGLAMGLVVVIAGFLVSSSPTIVNPMVARQEAVVAEPGHCRSARLPLLVLSGGVSSQIGSVDQTHLMYSATFIRLSEANRLVRQQPDTAVILAGGSARNGIAEADVMANFLRQKREFPIEQLMIERESDNTAESAIAVKKLLVAKGLPVQVRLLTSALHMQRSKAAYENQQIEVCPVVVDRQAIPRVTWTAMMPQTTALRKFDLLLHEWVGLLAYRLLGRL